MKDITIISNPTPDPNEVLVTFLDEDGLPRNVLLRREVTKDIDFGSEEVIATKALEIYVGEDVTKEGTKQRQIPPFNIKRNADRTSSDKAESNTTLDLGNKGN